MPAVIKSNLVKHGYSQDICVPYPISFIEQKNCKQIVDGWTKNRTSLTLDGQIVAPVIFSNV